MDIRQKDIARGHRYAHLVLHVQVKLKIVPPVAAVKSVVWNDRVRKENPQALEILVDAIQDDNVRRNDEKVARQLGIRLVELVKIAPCQHQAQHLRLAGTRGHLHHKAAPRLVEHPRRNRPGAVKTHQVVLVLHTGRVIEIHNRFDRFLLGEKIAELGHAAVGLRHQVRRLKPPVEQTPAGRACVSVAGVPEFLHPAANLRHKGWHQLFDTGLAQRLIRRKPTQVRGKNRMWGIRKVGVEGHYAIPESAGFMDRYLS